MAWSEQKECASRGSRQSKEVGQVNAGIRLVKQSRLEFKSEDKEHERE